MPNAILLNGVSSSGKSSIAHALQQRMDDLHLYLDIDVFLESLPLKYRRSDALWSTHQAQIMRTYLLAVRAILASGTSLILDNVLPAGNPLLPQLAQAVSDWNLYLVGVHCDLERLEAREAMRGDRHPGLARRQMAIWETHGEPSYDLCVDTGLLSAAEAAERIRSLVLSSRRPTAQSSLR